MYPHAHMRGDPPSTTSSQLLQINCHFSLLAARTSERREMSTYPMREPPPPPSGMRGFNVGQGGGTQLRSPAPCALVSPRWRGIGKRGGGKMKGMGWDTCLTGRGWGPRRLPTGGGSRWYRTPETCPPGYSGGWPWIVRTPIYSSRTRRYVSTSLSKECS